jgi:hypothetical protein
MCENDQPFEYGEEVQWGNERVDGEVVWQNEIFTYFAFQPLNTGWPHAIKTLSGALVAVKHVRRRRPDLKSGHPVLVSDGPYKPVHLRPFQAWCPTGRVVTGSGMTKWDNYALLKNYDYTADISEGI